MCEGWVVATIEIRARVEGDLEECGFEADRDALAKAQLVVDGVVATLFADHVSSEDLRRTARILDELADANPDDDGFDSGL